MKSVQESGPWLSRQPENPANITPVPDLLTHEFERSKKVPA